MGCGHMNEGFEILAARWLLQQVGMGSAFAADNA